MEPKPRTFSMWYAVVAIVLFLGGQALLLTPRPDKVSYSEFKALLKAGKVREVGLYKDTIEGTLSPAGLDAVLSKEKIDRIEHLGEGTYSFVTARVEDAALVSELEAASVRFTGQAESAWLSAPLSWIVPAVRFAGWSGLPAP